MWWSHGILSSLSRHRRGPRGRLPCRCTPLRAAAGDEPALAANRRARLAGQRSCHAPNVAVWPGFPVFCHFLL